MFITPSSPTIASSSPSFSVLCWVPCIIDAVLFSNAGCRKRDGFWGFCLLLLVLTFLGVDAERCIRGLGARPPPLRKSAVNGSEGVVVVDVVAPPRPPRGRASSASRDRLGADCVAVAVVLCCCIRCVGRMVAAKATSKRSRSTGNGTRGYRCCCCCWEVAGGGGVAVDVFFFLFLLFLLSGRLKLSGGGGCAPEPGGG